jgi:predicted ATPase
VDPSNPETSAVRLDWVDERDSIFGPHELSDGSLRAIALITALAQPAARLPAFITIDEPELGLHPAALGLLIELIRSVSSRCQVVLSTQSPLLLDMVDEEEVVVVERNNGETHLKRLARTELAAWRDEYTLSELYAKNVFGGSP